jgi:hypothetical protein
MTVKGFKTDVKGFEHSLGEVYTLPTCNCSSKLFGSIPFLLEAAVVLAAFDYPNHIVIYAHGDSLTCRLPAAPSCLGLCVALRIGKTKKGAILCALFIGASGKGLKITL